MHVAHPAFWLRWLSQDAPEPQRPAPYIRSSGRRSSTADNRRMTVYITSDDPAVSPQGPRAAFRAGEHKRVNPKLAAKLRRMLILLDRGNDRSALDMPGYRLHPLKGNRQGQWSATVSGNWRLIFEFEGKHATNVDLLDYH